MVYRSKLKLCHLIHPTYLVWANLCLHWEWSFSFLETSLKVLGFILLNGDSLMCLQIWMQEACDVLLRFLCLLVKVDGLDPGIQVLWAAPIHLLNHCFQFTTFDLLFNFFLDHLLFNLFLSFDLLHYFFLWLPTKQSSENRHLSVALDSHELLTPQMVLQK